MRRISRTLVIAVLALVALGVVMLASTSSVRGAANFGDPHFFLKRQLVWLFISVIAGIIAYRFDYHWLQKLSIPLAVLSVVLLVLVLVPGIGVRIGGSNRWLRFGPLSFQPSELAKLSTILMMATWMTHVGRRVTEFKQGLLFPVLGLGLVTGLLMLEPDFGTTLLVGIVGMAIMFVAGAKVAHLSGLAVCGGCAFVLVIMQNANRMRRIIAFLAPEKYPEVAYHLQQSKIAFHFGGLFGEGLGNSIQKHLYLPEAHTDFILAIIGEELGVIATCMVVILFITVVICGITISFKAPDTFGKLLAFGVTMMTGIQAAINIGVVTGSMPTKGLPLPFISYGGSSLLMSIVGISILLNIAQHCAEGHVDEHTRPIKDRAHRF